jgi:hypothetical protein
MNTPEESENVPVVVNNISNKTILPTVTSSMKWWLAIVLGGLFFIFGYGGTYNLTNTVLTTVGSPSYLIVPGCPNVLGVTSHALLFILCVRLILW